MAVPNYQARKILERVVGDRSIEELAERLKPRAPRDNPLPPHLPAGIDYSDEAVERRRQLLSQQSLQTGQLAGRESEISPSELVGSIEHFIGFARIPVGVVGPLRINGSNAHGDFYVPLATTEGALVASYNRGVHVISQAGGAAALCLTEAVSRAPCFVFRNLAEAGLFASWIVPRYDSLQAIVAGTSRYCQLVDLKTTLNGKEVYLSFEFTTEDAAGQNMVTIATEAICNALLKDAPTQPRHWYLEGNMSGDKKATMQAFLYTRGKDVVTEVALPARLVRRYLHTSPRDMVRYWEISTLGGIQSGSIGVQGHYANALAALFMACGQDVACVAEASVGVTRMDITEAGELYVSVKLPNLIVGTVGGGTYLPTARECLEMIGCYGAGKAQKFAEICAATALAGEVSIIAALASGEFGKAHAQYGRKPKRKDHDGSN